MARWHHRDHLASIRVTSSASGALAKRVSYRPYGEPETTAGTAPNDNETKGYIGEERDPETGLMYLNARYYDALRGSFCFIQHACNDPPDDPNKECNT